MRITARMGDELIIGKQGENDSVTICFPVSSILNEFGERGVFTVLHRRAEDDNSYQCKSTLKDETLEWTVSSADTAQVGLGQLELRYIVNERVVKSPTWRTRVLPALEEPTGIPPEPYKSWVDDVTAAGAAAVTAKNAIENMSVTARQTDTASVSKGTDAAGNVQLRFGIPRGADGYTPQKGKDYYTAEEIAAIKAEVTPRKGVDYFDGADGYTPQKGVDYYTPTEVAAIKAEVTPRKGVDYKDGENGKDGHTPQKGIDYFTPAEIDAFKAAATPRKGVDYFDGADGYSPVKNVDYFDGAPGQEGPPGPRGVSGVYIGTEQPTDPEYSVWIDTDGEATTGTVTAGEITAALGYTPANSATAALKSELPTAAGIKAAIKPELDAEYASRTAAAAEFSEGTISFKNAAGNVLFSAELPIYKGEAH